jgi:phospholipase/carboxylesterase
MATLASYSPGYVAVAALRGSVTFLATQFTWFENRGIGRPLLASLRSSIDWFRDWRDAMSA